MKSVFIFDGKSRATLQIVRSFGKRGFRVYVGNENWICSSFFSKYIYKRFKYPNPKSIAFKEFIFSLVKKYHFDLIVPVRDDTTIFCAKYCNGLKKYTNLLISDYDSILIGRDKSLTFEYARRYGVPMPETITVRSSEELLSYKGTFPIVLKPAISSGSRGLYIINNEESLKVVSKVIFKNYKKYLLQDFIPAHNTVGVNAILDQQNNVKAAFSYKRNREYPRGGGPSVLRESTYDKKLIEIATVFLKKLKWKGVAMLEFKIDSRDNIPKLMEINPRYWGSLALPIFAGVDFPFMMYCLARGENIKPIKEYRVGVQARWLFMGDFLWLFTSKYFSEDLKQFLHFKDDLMTYDIFSKSDPLPVAGAIMESIISFINPKRRKHALNRGEKLYNINE